MQISHKPSSCPVYVCTFGDEFKGIFPGRLRRAETQRPPVETIRMKAGDVVQVIFPEGYDHVFHDLRCAPSRRIEIRSEDGRLFELKVDEKNKADGGNCPDWVSFLALRVTDHEINVGELVFRVDILK